MLRAGRHWLIILCWALLVLGLATATATAGIPGVYELRAKDELRTLTVSEVTDQGILKFKLEVEKDGFSGGLSGWADLKGNTATYKTSKRECCFIITFKGNKAIISNANTQCRDYIKPGILLDGIYIKK
jgi:hypothetical protein